MMQHTNRPHPHVIAANKGRRQKASRSPDDTQGKWTARESTDVVISIAAEVGQSHVTANEPSL